MAEPPNTKRKKKDNVGIDMEVDRISELPDEILISILSRLSLKEAQATSVLSCRWRYTWTYTTNLDFDDEDRKIKLLVSSYIDWVNSVVNRHRATNVERFRVVHEIGPRSCVGEWIRYAMRKGVRVLVVDSTTIWHWCSQYKFTQHVLGIGESSAFNALCLEYSGFKFLKEVDFKHVEVNQRVVEYFIYNCPVLERVSVCDSDLLNNLRIAGHSIALKYLMISQCRNLKSIKIRDANLISFAYGGHGKKLRLRNLPRLVELSLFEKGQGTRKIDFSYFSCFFSQLETLKVDFMISWGKTNPVIPLLPNLKCMELAFDEADEFALFNLAFFLRQTPRLHTLVLEFRFMVFECIPKGPFVKKRASRFSLDCLKVVKFVEYYGLRRQDELVNYLMKSASGLEKIIFEPSHRRLRPSNLTLPRGVRMDLLSSGARELKEKLPATLDVVCL